MNISEKKVNDVVVLNLEGSLMGGPEAVSLNDAINRFLDQKSLKLVINLSSVERVNSSGLGSMMLIFQSKNLQMILLLWMKR